MLNPKIIIAGGTGFIGTYFAEQFMKEGNEVLIVSRQPGHINWNEESKLLAALEDSTLLINLAGKSVDCRYNQKNKKQIFESRILTTTMLGNAIKKCRNPPLLWINASTATIYRHSEDKAMTEANGEIGEGFSVTVARRWENAFFQFSLNNTRQVALRIAIVLGKNAGVMKPLTNLVRAGMGGRQGKGSQMFSWIHLEDLFQIIKFVQLNQHVKGILNCASPNPVTNIDLMYTLRKNMGQTIGLPLPEWMLKLGAVIISTEPELILKSRWVVPDRLQQEGFLFKYAAINNAISDLLND